MSQPSLVDLKSAYSRGENITQLLREPESSATNNQLAVLIAYDLQAGSYVRLLDEPNHRARVEKYADALAAVLAPLQPMSILEPGVGEATTLRAVLSRLSPPPGTPVLGYDISWSRIHVARRHLESTDTKASLFVGELEAIPLPDDAVDVVYTSHAVEPNHGREDTILAELYRVTGRYLVLFEPSYELASPEARRRMEIHGYCRELRERAERLGCKVIEHRLLDASLNPLNPTAVLVIEKQNQKRVATPPPFACPSCRGPLAPENGALFCSAEGLVYPVLRGIPCLARRDAVLASLYLN